MAADGNWRKLPHPKTPIPPGNRFADRLWWVMETHGHSALRVSRIVGVSCKTIFTYLSGCENPKVKVVVALAKHYGVTTDFLLGLSDDPSEAHGELSR